MVELGVLSGTLKINVTIYQGLTCFVRGCGWKSTVSDWSAGVGVHDGKHSPGGDGPCAQARDRAPRPTRRPPDDPPGRPDRTERAEYKRAPQVDPQFTSILPTVVGATATAAESSSSTQLAIAHRRTNDDGIFSSMWLLSPTLSAPYPLLQDQNNAYLSSENEGDPEAMLELLARIGQNIMRANELENSKRGLDLGLSRGYSGTQAAKHLMGMAAANFAGGPGRRRRSDMLPKLLIH
ncbi:Hypothetical protein CINCED_3A002137 [Cinara cedri]|uniref:Diuretic hormone class 2 n=1 Tax=Cinara cedri TaxID=506608 RepID=A0A5E4N3L1_9HEMI|nr:Hypothetical protein CINCED_3A002137 [Cinara cedri]